MFKNIILKSNIINIKKIKYLIFFLIINIFTFFLHFIFVQQQIFQKIPKK